MARKSEYEIARLERIKENQQMLEELFPTGTPKFDSRSLVKKPVRSVRRKRSDDCTDESGESESEDNRKKARYTVR